MKKQPIPPFFSREKVVILFFVLYFLVGISIFRDYGVSWDEFYMEAVGYYNLQYIQGKSNFLISAENSSGKYLAPFYETAITGTRQFLAEFDKDFSYRGRASTLYRHFFNFITFYIGVVFFYLLCRHRFKSVYLGLLGATFLILTPRLFSDAVYNSKDTVFLAYFVTTFYALLKFFEKRTFIRLTILAVLTGITFSIRVGVIFIPLFTILSFAGDYIFVKNFKKQFIKDLAQLLFYGVLTACVIFATYPILWSDPYHHFIRIIELYLHHPNNVPNLYFGKYVPAYTIPWHYIPVWMAITTPPVYIILFLTGLINVFIQLMKNIKQFYVTRREDILFLLWFFFPLVSVMVSHGVLYNSWRHMFFIYPAFIIIAIHGVLYMKDFMHRYATNRIVISVLSLFLVLNFVFVARAMIELHPFEHLYFNFLVGTDMKKIRKNFETDYWGLTVRKGLEFLLTYDKSNQIVIIGDYPVWSNQWILSDKDRKRVYVGHPWDTEGPKPKYYMTNFYVTQNEPPYKELFAMKVKDVSLLKVYELPASADIRFDGKFPYR